MDCSRSSRSSHEAVCRSLVWAFPSPESLQIAIGGSLLRVPDLAHLALLPLFAHHPTLRDLLVVALANSYERVSFLSKFAFRAYLRSILVKKGRHANARKQGTIVGQWISNPLLYYIHLVVTRPPSLVAY